MGVVRRRLVEHHVAMTLTEDQSLPRAIEPKPGSSVLTKLITVAIASGILLIALVVLLVKVSQLQDDVTLLQHTQDAGHVVSIDPQTAASEADVCRLLGALAAKSNLTLTSLFPDSTVGACEQAATEGYHQALTLR